MKNLKIATRLVILISILSALLIGIGAMGLLGMRQSSDAIKTVHDEAMRPALMADESINKITQNRLQVLLAFQHAPDGPLASIHTHPTSTHTEAITANRAEANRLFKEMEALAANPEEKAIFETTKSTRDIWRDKLDQAVKTINEGDFSPSVMAQFLKAGREEGEATIKSLIGYRDFQIKRADD